MSRISRILKIYKPKSEKDPKLLFPKAGKIPMISNFPEIGKIKKTRKMKKLVKSKNWQNH